MSSTMFAHAGCNGPVVLDASNSVKLVAPSIGLTDSGIQAVMLDISYQSGVIHPDWMCTKCQQQIGSDNLSEILCVCHSCSEQVPVPQISSKNGHLMICDSCREKVQSTLDGVPVEDVEDIIKVFGITKDTKFTPLSEILSKDIPLG